MSAPAVDLLDPIEETGRPDLYEIIPNDDGTARLVLNFHKGQEEAWLAKERFVGILSGTQSGKTALGPFWLWREIYGGGDTVGRGPGDYLAVTANYGLFKLKMLPAIRELFENILGLGRYWAGDRMIELRPSRDVPFSARRSSDPMWGRIILRSAESPSGLESSTASGAWLDEAGQDSFKAETWRAVLSRLSLNLGRVLITTTLFNFGWLKKDFYDRWKAGDPDYKVVHFDSIMNPRFKRSEWNRAKRSIPGWIFDLRYRGRYSRPAGLIYDSYHDDPQPEGNLVPRFEVPWTWDHYLGLDFGGVNTAGLAFACNPDGVGPLYGYREYHAGDRSIAQHVESLTRGEPPFKAVVGGAPSEDQWRREFTKSGLKVIQPDIASVDVGINRVWGGFQSRKVLLFDDLERTRKELTNYSRKLDKDGEPTEIIEDKEKYHLADAGRYILGWLLGPAVSEQVITTAPDPRQSYNARSGRPKENLPDTYPRRAARRGGF